MTALVFLLKFNCSTSDFDIFLCNQIGDFDLLDEVEAPTVGSGDHYLGGAEIDAEGKSDPTDNIQEVSLILRSTSTLHDHLEGLVKV